MISLDRLPNQEKGEKIELYLRRHVFILLKDIFLFIFLGFLPVLVGMILNFSFPSILDNDFAYILVVLSVSLYYFFVWLIFLGQFVDYYLDIWIVTNKRIINIEQHGLFNRTIAEQRLYRVQDVTSEVKGFIPTLLHYGNIYIQTAAEKQRFGFEQVPNPYEVRKRVLELVEQDRQSQPPADNQDYETMLKKAGAE